MTKTTEESVVLAMDGTDSHLYPYLPYILQDIWEIGTSPEIVIELIRKHTNDYSNLNILDLGCGKGAVTINVAKAFKCQCYGIDAIKDFICEANKKAKEFSVENDCRFECADIRDKAYRLNAYNVIILGSIGPVFGDYYQTLSTLAKPLKDNGFIIIDEAYIEDTSQFSHPSIEKKSIILKQISEANMQLIDQVIINQEAVAESDEYLFQAIKRRCQELIAKYPDKSNLFIDYIKQQAKENDVLENEVICSTLLIRKP